MVSSIRMDSLSLKCADAQQTFRICNRGRDFSTASSEKKTDGNTIDTILNISKEAKAKLKNWTEEGTFKKAGVTSAREQFEIDALDWKRNRSSFAENPYPLMRLDEPETYAKAEAFLKKCTECGGSGTVEGFKCWQEWGDIRHDWFRRRCFDAAGNLRNPVTGQCSMITALETRYSDSVHDTSIDVYDDCFEEEDATPWRFGTKFNVTMPVELLKELELIQNMDELSEKEKRELQEKMNKVDAAVSNMKEVEKNYEGEYMYLRFGVKLDRNANATYYANYTGCREEFGISASTPEELLEKLMSK